MMIDKISLYVLGWCIYGMQGGFLPKGVFFAKILCFILLSVSAYHFVIANIKYHLPRYFVGLNLLLGMFTVYGIYLIQFGSPELLPGEYLKSVLISLLPIYSFFVFFKENNFSDKKLYFLIYCLLFFSIINFYGKLYSLSFLRDGWIGDFTNNSGYLFIPLIAASVLLKNKIIQAIFFVVCESYIILSSKRGCMIIGMIVLILFLIREMKGKKKKIITFFLAVVLSVCGAYMFNKQMSDGYALQKKIADMEEGEGSGRASLYSELSYYFWNDTDPIHFLFGSGANATLGITSYYAHNDWIEIAINQGVFGIFIYLIYWIIFAKTCMSNRLNYRQKMALWLIFVIYFMQTLFSMSYNAMTTGATLVLGYCLSQEEKDDFSIALS